MISAWGVRLAVVGLALAASATCAQGRSAVSALAPCTGPGADTTGWKVEDAGPFRLSVPNEYQRQTMQGIDSFVGLWVVPGRGSVHFDWGMYSARLDEPSTPWEDRAECTAGIGGYRARLVGGFNTEAQGEAKGQTYAIVAASWRDVQPGTHLTLSAISPDPADIPILLSIVRSVRFQPGTPVR